MDRASRKRLARLQKQEARTAARYEKAKPSVFASVQDKIPDGLRDKLETAFCKGFRLVFEKGDSLIAKTYNAESLRQEYEENEQALSDRVTGRRLRRFAARSRAAVRGGTGDRARGGRGAGRARRRAAGYPLFLAGLLRGLYRIAQSCGFACESEGERCYLLLLIAASLSRGEERERLSALADDAAQGARPRRGMPAVARRVHRQRSRTARERDAGGKICAGACRWWASRADCRTCRSTGGSRRTPPGPMKNALCCARG